MTKEQQAWYEYGREYESYRGIKLFTPAAYRRQWWKRYDEARDIIQDVWDARKKAMAWIPTRLRTCENCACCLEDEYEPNGWSCESEIFCSGCYAPDVCGCPMWEPKEGGAQ